MTKTIRIGLIIIGSGLLLPFLLQTDLYPYLRYGMFAEPVQEELPAEHFLLRRTLSTGHSLLLDHGRFDLEASTFHYLCRNHYYRGETQHLLATLITPERRYQEEPYAGFALLRISEGDTSLVDQLTPAQIKALWQD